MKKKAKGGKITWMQKQYCVNFKQNTLIKN